MCVNAHGRARLREQIVARKVVDRGPCEMMPSPPACARTGLKVTCTWPTTKPWLMPASPVLHAHDGSHGEAGVSPRALRCSIHQRTGLRHGQPARPGCGSSGRTVRIHEPASTESVRFEPRRRADRPAPEGPRVRRSRFRHGGYLLPKGSWVHESGATPVRRLPRSLRGGGGRIHGRTGVRHGQCAAARRLSPNTAQVASRRRPPVQASVLTFISTWMAKSRRMLAGVARKRSMAARTSLMSAITRDFLTGWSGS